MKYGCYFVGYEINGDFCKLSEQRVGSLNDIENTLYIPPQSIPFTFPIPQHLFGKKSKVLAQIRKLLGVNVQINIAEQQVNVAG